MAKTMGILAGILALMFIAVAPSVHGAQTYTVDWTLGTDYSSWATKAINTGDTIVFNYDGSHNVEVVDQSDYTNCVSSNAIQTYSNGKSSITLTQSGPMYFICGFPGHCSGGMQLQINVQASSSSSGGSSTTPSTPSTSPASTTPTTTTTTGSSGTAATSNINGLIFGLSVVLGTLFAFKG
ncbi:hypothetical protein Droror1_Dr00005068 [Drosera rotundifolia]